MTDTESGAVRRGRREGGGRRATGGGGRNLVPQLPRRKLKRLFPAMEIVSADELESIHRASLKVLSEIGMDFTLPQARDMLRKAGAKVEGERVRFDPAMIEELISTVPSEFTFHARNPDNDLRIGGANIAFGTVASPPNASDIDGGRRTGNYQDFRNFLKLGQYFNCIDFLSGYPVEPIDIHASIRHLEALRDMVLLTDKPFHAYSLGAERIRDGIEIARIGRGISHEQLEREPSLFTIINTNSPLKLDTPMLNGILEMSSRNQIVCVTPFTLAGAMAPVTVAGALVEQNAEALAGIAFTQLVRRGAPVIYGGFTSNVDMKSGAPAFGTPEYMKATIVGGQLARRYNAPFRTSNTCAANAVDAQAAYESVFSLWGLAMGGGNLIMHGAGWLEGGLVASFEKFVLDCDLIQMVGEFMQPLETTEDALGVEAIREVGPGGHFFGARHTLQRYTNAFYSPIISDWRNNQQWLAAGKPEAWQKANAVWKQALADYQEPAIDPAIRDELNAFVAKRKAEGGAPTDF
ncbi:trimethylamine methyltransferase family protein [Aestuariivirga sp.]|uniref:trimethylamine methyltransferase family protein n=1 Tax=Aestuariivirga sp. TaxID=2650926 RepID=UPI0025B81E24|nr:trimethylamine methyltransferase family protein [Aestuariivirga sp.]MCA3555689.1 trimethylamine methyltransferase family protein [Aestuariivirga sp.]